MGMIGDPPDEPTGQEAQTSPASASGPAEERPDVRQRVQRNRTRTLVIDDELVFRLGLRLYLGGAMPELDLVGEAGSADEGLALAGLESPDLVLLDASIRDGQTNALVAELSRLLPRCRLVLLASLPDPAGLALAMDSGAHGYLLKTSAHECLLTAIATVLSGGIWIQPELRGPAGSRVTRAVDPAAVQASPAPILTARQVDVLRLVALGLSNAEIAARLFISNETVKTHIAQMLRRLRIRSRVQAARYAIRNGLADA